MLLKSESVQLKGVAIMTMVFFTYSIELKMLIYVLIVCICLIYL